jgi:surfactin synthase thioesterase subunit
MGGTPAAILDDPELRELFLPTIRAGFAWGDDYRYRPAPPLTCPLSAFAGAADPEAPADDVAAWSTETTGRFTLHVLDGGHFFLHDRFGELADLLVQDLPELRDVADRPGRRPRR